jgi:serine phosphatase RsbU (regulator of sigma subunit)
VPRVAVYLRGEGDRLEPAADRGLAGPHALVAQRLLELALGPGRPKGVVQVADARLRGARDAARKAGIDAALAAPLIVRDDVIGLLAVYPEGGHRATENESALLAALAGQLAVAVQNAQLHERATELGRLREEALASEREAAKRLRALYEISRSFAQSLSLEATLEALARTVVDVLDLDAAVIRLPDERREQLVPRSIHVRDEQLGRAARAILYRPQPFGTSGVQRLFRDRAPFRLSRNVGLGHGAELLAPFLEKGWTGAVVPVATPAEVIASLTIFSFRPGEPIGEEAIDAAVAIAGQAALAIDNARLYQQQKAFADTMQRSLLPRVRPAVAGLEVGEVYQSSARVDVGGDVYDYLTLEDGRLAVVLGDVTGHGVEATADMAMAKFVFRSLAREHPEPADFLAAANDVVVDEIATGKFITMTYVAVDGARGKVACASAGHPAPRLVLPDGTVRGLEATGIVLGIDEDQVYDEVSAELPPGAALVLYTDGVVEARRDGELYGFERLDALLAKRHDLPARALALAVTEDCRSFAGGELADDVAVVVIRRT